MDKVSQTFDKWANNGRAEKMEKEHGKSVNQFLDKIRWKDKFSFLDVGCGNGWAVRKIAQINHCKTATGIDKSEKMIRRAKDIKVTEKENYIHTDIESLNSRKKFDYIFAMESLYYSESVKVALEKIYILLNSGGEFFCGTDFYADNKATSNWPKTINLQMHLYSKKEWSALFKDVGFQVRTKQIKDVNDKRVWRREFGTLFIIGKKII